MLLVTDRYRVRDWEKVAAVLAAQPDVEGDPAQGWERRIDCDDGQVRSAAVITRTRDGEHLIVFCRTQHDANDSRNWFDAIMTDAVEFRIRDIQGNRSAARARDIGYPAGADAYLRELAR